MIRERTRMFDYLWARDAQLFSEKGHNKRLQITTKQKMVVTY